MISKDFAWKARMPTYFQLSFSMKLVKPKYYTCYSFLLLLFS